MNSFKNKCKRESTKNKIVSVSGSGHETHYSKKFIEQRKQSILHIFVRYLSIVQTL